MSETLGSLLFVVFVWWFATGVVLLLGRLGKSTFGWSFAFATVVLVMSLIGLSISSESLSTTNIVISFSCVIGIWAWHEMAFLFGYITGPRTLPSPKGAEGWNRFTHAFSALLYHELALFATLVIVVAITWGNDNLYGLAAFAILWVMRISAKLNIFFGVPHFSDDLLPPHLSHLATYFRVRPPSLFFGITVTLSAAVAAALLGRLLFGVDLSEADTVGLSVSLCLLLLAILEHGFMILPVKDANLWRWAMIDPPARQKKGRALQVPLRSIEHDHRVTQE